MGVQSAAEWEYSRQRNGSTVGSGMGVQSAAEWDSRQRNGTVGSGMDYNWLKVVWHDGSWLGESLADIQKYFNCPFNFILN
jgi:hypothetical protein